MPHTEADLNGADLMLFVGTGGGGVAWVGVICDNKGNSSKGIENKTIRRHNGRPLFIFITGLDYKKTKFLSVILKSFWDFFILCSAPLLGKHRIKLILPRMI